MKIPTEVKRKKRRAGLRSCSIFCSFLNKNVVTERIKRRFFLRAYTRDKMLLLKILFIFSIFFSEILAILRKI